MSVKIVVSKPEDVWEIRRVQKLTWLETYPNKKAGIALADIEAVFKDDDTLEGKKRIEEGKKRYRDSNFRVWVAKKEKKIVGFCRATLPHIIKKQLIFTRSLGL